MYAIPSQGVYIPPTGDTLLIYPYVLAPDELRIVSKIYEKI
jgi:hypothetical protein